MPLSASISSSASACGTVRGKPSRMKPFAQSGWSIRSAIDADHDLVGHQLAGSMIALALSPIGVPAATAARSMSPVESCGMPYFFDETCRLRSLARPRRSEQNQPHRLLPRSFDFLDQALILMRLQMAVDLRHGVHRHADHDQQRRAAEIERHVGVGDRESPAGGRSAHR